MTKRSRQEEKLYRKWTNEISNQITTDDGEFLSAAEWHELNLQRYHGIKQITFNGKTYYLPKKRSNDMKHDEFHNFVQDSEAAFVQIGAELTFPESSNE